MTATPHPEGSAHRGYKSMFDVGKGPSYHTTPTEDCAIDWPDFADEGDPIHLDTCIIMTGDDRFCTCGLTILEKAGARFR